MLDLRRHLPTALIAAPVALAVLATGCGGGSESTSADAPNASAFPDPAGKTLEQIAQEGTQSDVAVAPTESVFSQGKNRYGFGVFSVNGDQIDDARVALYASKPGKPAIGPFPAAVESLETSGAYTSATTSNDPQAATAVYTTTVDFPSDGRWQMLAMVADDDGSFQYSAVQPANVGAPNNIPAVGDPVPDIHTPTADDVGGDLTKIDTRQPPDDMHDIDFADVVGKEPVALLFATPALCQSRVCGPVVDILEEVKNERPDDAAFIHMEIYNDNQPDASKPDNNARSQVTDFGLMSEPWLFVIDSDGKVSTRIEGAFSADELNEALDKVS
ncbi:MAG: hypothetical protein U0R24_06775 [Solirubrobacterales bacterium]